MSKENDKADRVWDIDVSNYIRVNPKYPIVEDAVAEMISFDDIEEVYLHLNDVLDKLNNVIDTYDDLTCAVLRTKDLDEVWYLVKETGAEISEAQGAACEIGRIVESWRKGADLDDRRKQK